MAEVFISNDEPLDIERLQAGGLATPETTIWLGRHHSPLDYWSTQFHHGAYLQTAIKRPAISEFDDHGGILPNHLSGLFIEGQHAQGDAAIGYALSFCYVMPTWPCITPKEPRAARATTLMT